MEYLYRISINVREPCAKYSETTNYNSICGDKVFEIVPELLIPFISLILCSIGAEGISGLDALCKSR